MRILIVHNSKAGQSGDDIYNYARAILENDGIEVVMRAVRDTETTNELVRDAEDFDAVVISGGDGTAANVNYALHGRGVPTLIFPSGTTNLLSRNLGNASEAVALAKATKEGKTAKFDMGELTYTDNDGVTQKRGFSIIAGAGYDATIMNESVRLKESLGMLGYFAAALANPAPQVSKFTVEVDGETHELEGIAVLIVNFGTLPFDLNVVHGNDPQDGLFEVVVAKPSKTIQLLPTVISALLDKDGKFPHRPQLETFVGKDVSVTADPPLAMQYDGEFISDATTPFRATVLKGATTFIVDGLSPYAEQASEKEKEEAEPEAEPAATEQAKPSEAAADNNADA